MEQPSYLAKVKFIIADDNAFMRTIIRRILSALGVLEICEVSDGVEALEINKTWKADIILVDWEMAPLNGIKLTQAIRQSSHSEECFTSIIMISAHSEYWRIQQARNAGVNEFLVKPVSPKALFSRIRAVIEHPRQFVKVASYFGPDRRRQDLKHGDERREIRQVLTPIPAEQLMQQDQINAIFNPGSKQPDE